MSIPWHCPICYDGPSLCKCTEKDYDEYYNNIEKDKEKSWKIKRTQYHNLLDKSFGRYRKDQFDCDDGTFPFYLGKEIMKLMTRKEWEKLKKQFDKYFNI